MASKKITILAAVIILGLGFFLLAPYLYQEVAYFSTRAVGIYYSLNGGGRDTLKPISNNFSLMILSLGINKRVVSLESTDDYESSLRDNLVHFKDSVFPGKIGKAVFLAHSLKKVFNWKQLNPEFYLVYKLKEGDQIEVIYKGVNYRYRVESKEIMNPDEVNFFEETVTERKMLLVAGFPPGTSFKALVIEAKEVYD